MLTAPALRNHLATRPDSLFRLKGFAPAPRGGPWEVHCVGPTIDIKPSADTPIQLVGIGLAASLDAEAIDIWWHHPRWRRPWDGGRGEFQRR